MYIYAVQSDIKSFRDQSHRIKGAFADFCLSLCRSRGYVLEFTPELKEAGSHLFAENSLDINES